MAADNKNEFKSGFKEKNENGFLRLQIGVWLDFVDVEKLDCFAGLLVKFAVEMIVTVAPHKRWEINRNMNKIILILSTMKMCNFIILCTIYI